MTTGASRVEPPAPPTRHPLPCPRPHSGAVEEPAGPGEDPQGIFIKAFASPAPVAQGIEHSSPKAGVAGSNPAWGTTARAPSGVTTGQFRGVILSNWPVVVLPARQTAGSAVPPARRIVHRVSDPSRTPTRESAPQRRAPGAGYTVGAGRGVLLVPQDVPSGRTCGPRWCRESGRLCPPGTTVPVPFGSGLRGARSHRRHRTVPFRGTAAAVLSQAAP